MKALQKDYSITTILILWLIVTVPMGLIRFWIFPMMIPKISIHPGILFWLHMIVGMIWQFIVSVVILRLEIGCLDFEKIKARIWLNNPRIRDGQIVKRVYWLTIPIILYALAINFSGLFEFTEKILGDVFPSLIPSAETKMDNLVNPEFSGALWLIPLAIVSCLFNYLLGEELFFRGILLPKMGRVFGRWDWIANGLLFATYHVHKILVIPALIVFGFFTPLLNRKFKTFWPAVIIHGFEGLPLLAAVVWIVFIM